MNYEFKGTPGPWLYEKPTELLEACTVSESGKMIGYCVKSNKEDCYNELLRSKALEMFDRLKRVLDLSPILKYQGKVDLCNVGEAEAIVNMMNSIEQLLKQATEL